jgi:beta-lactamase regulating signal transducer with metallopeptidase domain
MSASTLAGAAGQVAAWLATYALHSTILLGLAWLASRRLAGRSIQLEEAVWRAALLGALLTATLQTAGGWTPLAGSFRLPTGSAAAALSPAAPAPVAFSAPAPDSASAASAPLARSSAAPDVARFTVTAPARPAARQGSGVPLRWPALAAGTWAALALLLVLRLAMSYAGLRRRLRSRAEISGGTIAHLLARLKPAAGIARPVRLTCSHRLAVPIARGHVRPEICVPPRALSHLSPEQQESLLAHELAHLARRDPSWLAACRVLALSFFFQPLNGLAARRLRELSELAADEWAVARTGRPLTLAGCLAEVARWSIGGGAPVPAPGMADASSRLGERIRRLVDDRRSADRALPRGLVAALAVLVLAAVAIVAPSVSASARADEGARAASPEARPAAAPALPQIAEAPDAPEAPEVSGAPEAPEAAEAPDVSEAPDASQASDDLADTPSSPAPAPRPPVRPSPAPRPAPVHLPGIAPLPAPAPYARMATAAPMAPEPPVPPIPIAAPAAAAPAPPPPPPAPPRPHPLSRAERANLEAFRARAEQLSREGTLSQAEIDRLVAEADRLSRAITERLQPQMERLAALAAELAAKVPSGNAADSADFERQIDSLVEHLKPSPEALERLAEDGRRLATDRNLSQQERTRLEKEMHRLSTAPPLSEEDKANLKRLQERARKVVGGLDRAEIQELEASRRELEAEARSLRQEIDREMGPALQQLKDQKGALEDAQREGRDRASRERAKRSRPTPEAPPPAPPEPPGASR